MTEGMFGEGGASWGSSELNVADLQQAVLEGTTHEMLPRDDTGATLMPPRIELGNGFALVTPNPAALSQRLLHGPEAVAQVTARSQELTNAANSLAVIEGAEYTYTVSNDGAYTRCRGTVKTANFAAILDNAHHSTLLKALASVGSDPYPTGSAELPGIDEPDVESTTTSMLDAPVAVEDAE